MERKILENYIKQGMSQRDIQKATGHSQTNVRYWLNKHGLKTNNISYTKNIYTGKYIEQICKHHGVTVFIYEKSKNGYRCKKCRSGRVNDQRRALKQRLVEEMGGQCINCGYNKSIWSLEFHHRNPDEKERNIGELIRDRKYSEAKHEIEKCDLLCSNCHGEIEEQKWIKTIPLQAETVSSARLKPERTAFNSSAMD